MGYEVGSLIEVMSDSGNAKVRRVLRCCPLEAWHRNGGCSDDQRRVLGALQADMLRLLPPGRDETMQPVDGGGRSMLGPQERHSDALGRLRQARAALSSLGNRRQERAWTVLRDVLAEGWSIWSVARARRMKHATVCRLLRESADALLEARAYERERWRVSVWAMGAYSEQKRP